MGTHFEQVQDVADGIFVHKPYDFADTPPLSRTPLIYKHNVGIEKFLIQFWHVTSL